MAELKQGESGEGSDEGLSAAEDFANEFIGSTTGSDLGDGDPSEPVVAAGEGEDDQGAGTGVDGDSVEESQPDTGLETATPEPRLYTLPDTAEYGQLRGRKVTLTQLEEAGLLEKIFTREHQETHHQTLYQRLKQEFDEFRATHTAQAEAARAAAAQPAQPAQTPEQFAQNLESQIIPELSQLAQAGAFEEDFIRIYPKVAAHLENRFRHGGMGLFGTIQQVTKLTERINDISEFVGMERQTRATASAQETIYGRLTELSQKVPALADEGVQKRFVQWASDENNRLTDRMATKDVSEVTAEELHGAFAAYVAMTGDGLRRPPKARSNANLAGSGGASSGGAGRGGERSPGNKAEAFEQEFIGSQRY